MQLTDQPIPLRRTFRLYIVMETILVALALVVMVVATVPLLKHWLLGQALPNDVRSIVFVDVLVGLLVMGSIHEARRPMIQHFTKAGIHEGKRFVAWNEVKSYRVTPARIEVRSPSKKITINLWTFKEPRQVVALVRSCASGVER
jgi:hypothetical protein